MSRIVIGALFIYAALAKIGAAQPFALQIENYDILPVGYENLAAIVLPWIELVAGLTLVFGVWARSAAWVAVALMGVFTLAVGVAMARGLNVECGCFGSGDATRVGLPKLIENLVMTGLALVGSARLE
jgi:uncharacterized membrane protein YphA (DoxX/SURF4 family)